MSRERAERASGECETIPDWRRADWGEGRLWRGAIGVGGGNGSEHEPRAAARAGGALGEAGRPARGTSGAASQGAARVASQGAVAAWGAAVVASLAGMLRRRGVRPHGPAQAGGGAAAGVLRRWGGSRTGRRQPTRGAGRLRRLRAGGAATRRRPHGLVAVSGGECPRAWRCTVARLGMKKLLKPCTENRKITEELDFLSQSMSYYSSCYNFSPCILLRLSLVIYGMIFSFFS